MLKKVYGRKLSRERDSRRALIRSLIRALVMHGKIKTTKAKALTVSPAVDKLITLAKKETDFARKKVFARLGNDKKTAKIIFDKLVPMFAKRPGGFTRIINLPRRSGDNAEMVILEFVEQIKKTETETEKKEKGKKKKIRK